jgi:hypothetical protein
MLKEGQTRREPGGREGERRPLEHLNRSRMIFLAEALDWLVRLCCGRGAVARAVEQEGGHVVVTRQVLDRLEVDRWGGACA